jgi:cytochrome c
VFHCRRHRQSYTWVVVGDFIIKEKIMSVRNILLVSLLVSLYGCQPDVPPAPKDAAPAASEQVVPPQPAVIQDATPPVEDAPAAAEPVAAEKVAQAAPVEEAQAAEKQTSSPPAVEEKTAPVQAVEIVPTPVPAPDTAPVEVKSEAEPVAKMSEADGMQLAKKSNCLGCHALDKKKVGPAFRDVAAKYRGDAGAEEHLVNAIGKGGRGVWGVMAMPPNLQVSEANRRLLARFVLSLK